ncbi:MAG: hypothetical protein R3F59_32445 [Myxococcota bacterium]
MPDFESIDALGGDARFTSPTATTALTWNAADVRYNNYDLRPPEFVPGETYDIDVVNAPGIPELHLADALSVPNHFSVTDPRIAGTTYPDIAADHHFQWSTEEEGDAVLLQVGLVNDDGTAFAEELHCAVRDTGSFWLPADQWVDWIPGRHVHVLIGRYTTARGLLPWNRGRIEVASQLWYYGVGNSE